MNTGDRAPDITLDGPDGPLRLADALTDGSVVLVFFQEAGTPACAAELRAFGVDYDLIRELGARVLAVSTDAREEQRSFAETLSLPFPVLTDHDAVAARAFDVYDPTSRRARRAVFVIGGDGVIRHAIPWFNPQNATQLGDVFIALGLTPDAGA